MWVRIWKSLQYRLNLMVPDNLSECSNLATLPREWLRLNMSEKHEKSSKSNSYGPVNRFCFRLFRYTYYVYLTYHKTWRLLPPLLYPVVSGHC